MNLTHGQYWPKSKKNLTPGRLKKNMSGNISPVPASGVKKLSAGWL